MLNRLPTIGRRLGPGGYGRRFFPGYHTNRAQLNKIVKMPRGNTSDRARMDMAIGQCGEGTVGLEGETSLRCVSFYNHKSNAQEFQKVRSRLTCMFRERKRGYRSLPILPRGYQ